MECVKYLSFYLINATSLAKPHAIQLLQTEISSENFDMVLVTETWFTQMHLNTYVAIPNYVIFRRDRGRRGGGVCAYVRSDISCVITSFRKVDAVVKKNYIEIMWLQCCHNNVEYFIACCYHPPRPKYHVSEFVDALSHDLDIIINNNSNSVVIVAGDFNQLDSSL
jgi:hypothetical protein